MVQHNIRSRFVGRTHVRYLIYSPKWDGKYLAIALTGNATNTIQRRTR